MTKMGSIQQPRPNAQENMHFRRHDNRLRTKKIQRKLKVRSFHIALWFALLVLFFIGIQRLYLFLISWEKLNIRHVEIMCGRTDVHRDVERCLEGKYLGNILLFDIDRLHNTLSGHPWIQGVRIRKNFDPALNIMIRERIPAAVIEGPQPVLIDREGVILEQVTEAAYPHLPRLRGRQAAILEEKTMLELAWRCLDSFPPENRERIETLDLSQYANIKIKFRDIPTWLILGDDRFQEKVLSYYAERPYLRRFGVLEYADLRFSDRFIIKPRPHQTEEFFISPIKEAY